MLTALKNNDSFVTTRDGAWADSDGDKLRVHAADGAVLFEYDAATGKGTLRMPKHLRLETPGDIELVAGKRLKMEAQDAETKFDSFVEHIGNAFRYVRELQQTKAGRLRSLVKGAIQLKGGRMTMLAQKDVHIDGERINLG